MNKTILISTLLLITIHANALELTCKILPQLFTLYTRFHVLYHSVTPELKARTVEQFVKGLDPSKTLLYQADVNLLKENLKDIWSKMEADDCSRISDVSKLLVERAKENERIAKDFLNEKYKLDETAELITDPDKRKYPLNPEDKKQLIQKMIHFQVSNYLLSKVKIEEAKKNVFHSYELVVKRLSEKNAEKRFVDFAESFAVSLDPHSSYMSRETLEDFRINMQLSLEGIGASLSPQDGFTVIEEIIPGGAADRMKILKPKDKIIAVAQEGGKPETVIDWDLNDVVRKIRGKKGTKVTLTILRQGDKNETFNVTIVRDKVDIKDSAAKLSYETKKIGDKTFKIGVIDLPSFYGGGQGERSSYLDMKKLVKEAVKNKVNGLIIDLSRNGGGLLDDAVRIAGLFIKKGAVVATKGSDDKVDILSDSDENTHYNGPLMLLTSRLSASASEILSGALKDYKRAIVVGGDHTYGKGSVQVVMPQSIGAMKVTQGMFYIPGGKSTQHLGVDSDIILPSAFNDEDIGEKMMDYSLPQQKIQTFLGNDANSSDPTQKWAPVSEGTIKTLALKSAERVAKDPKFIELKNTIEEAKRNKGLIKLADLRKKAEKDNKESKKDKRGKEKIKESQAPFIKESVQIMTDWLAL